jgi:hypothetical protein
MALSLLTLAVSAEPEKVERGPAMSRLLTMCLILIVGTWQLLAAPAISLPNRVDTVKFAVLGDNGSGDRGQQDVAAQMAAVRQVFPFQFVVMLGDNFYADEMFFQTISRTGASVDSGVIPRGPARPGTM